LTSLEVEKSGVQFFLMKKRRNLLYFINFQVLTVPQARWLETIHFPQTGYAPSADENIQRFDGLQIKKGCDVEAVSPAVDGAPHHLRLNFRELSPQKGLGKNV